MSRSTTFESCMAGATVFSTLDARSGFWQIQLEEESSFLTTFSTPCGSYRYLRMPFGLSTASEVSQWTMELLFAGYPCEIIVDDILVWGRDVAEHDVNLAKVMERAKEINLKLKASASFDWKASRMSVICSPRMV